MMHVFRNPAGLDQFHAMAEAYKLLFTRHISIPLYSTGLSNSLSKNNSLSLIREFLQCLSGFAFKAGHQNGERH